MPWSCLAGIAPGVERQAEFVPFQAGDEKPKPRPSRSTGEVSDTGEQLHLGESVHVWSKSKNCWIEDGEVSRIAREDRPGLDRPPPRMRDGRPVPPGAVLVTYQRGAAVKWVFPEEIPATLRSRGGRPYVDREFNVAVGGRVTCCCRPLEIGTHDGKVVHQPWDPFSIFSPSTPEPAADWRVFLEDPRADDVVQGELGDCWFLSSLAVLAEFENGRFIRDLITGQERDERINPYGAYHVSLCIGGCWRDVLVDDRLPCIGGGRYYTQLAFCVTRRFQLWASLIEKAYAKACGSYEAIVGGEAGEALSTLTGWPCTLIRFDRRDFHPDILWATLWSSQDTKYLMTCSTAHVRPADAESLVPFHVYSLMAVFDVETAGGRPVRLVKIRNPHSGLKWRGAWSAGSPEWTQALRDKVGFNEETFGIFFMSLEDFLDRFAHCTICRIRSHEWKIARTELELPSGDVPATGIHLELPEKAEVTTECCLSLAQPDERVRKGPLCAGIDPNLACIGFVLVPRNAAAGQQAVASAHIRTRAVVSADFWMEPGEPCTLVPLSLNIGRPLMTSCACVSSNPVKLEACSLSKEAIKAAWAAWTRRNDSAGGEHFHGGTLYLGKADGGAIVAMAENPTEGYFGVELTIHSESHRFSRSIHRTMDWLGPGEGLVLQVAIPDSRSGGSASWRSSHMFYKRFTPPDQERHAPPAGALWGGLHTPFPLGANARE